MQHKLEEMLMTVVQKFEVPPMELLKFVEYPFTVSIHVHVYMYSALEHCPLLVFVVRLTYKHYGRV